MKQKITSFLLLVMMWLAGVNAWALDQKDGVYQIGSAQDLADFAALVNGGEAAVNAVMTADIDLTGIDFAGIGAQEAPYSGVFDGQAHTISGYTKTTTSDYTGLFGRVKDATVKNITLKGDLTLAHARCGFIGHAESTGTFTGLISYLNLNFTQKCAHVGGIVGSLNGKCEVAYCEFRGTLTYVEDGVDSNGAMVGYANEGYIHHNVFAGTINYPVDVTEVKQISGILGYVNNTNFQGFHDNICIGKTNTAAFIGQVNTNTPTEKIYNNYWMEGSALFAFAGAKAPTAGVEATPAADFASGKVAYKTGLFQNLSEDGFPSADATRGQVYISGTVNCDGSYADDVTFSNTKTDGPTNIEHKIVDGFCSVCGNMEVSEDGYYLVSNAKCLKWVADQFNTGKCNTMKFRLTADIDLSGENWTPIGMDDNHGFSGEMDGGRHKISNMKVDSEGLAGLFGTINSNAYIHDFIIDETCSIVGRDRTGGVAGHSINAGILKIERVGVMCLVACRRADGSNYDAVGGILGNANASNTSQISQCFFLGQLEGNARKCVFNGWANANDSYLRDCWYVMETPPDGLVKYGKVEVSNCWGPEQGVTEDKIKSGELCYMLNGTQENIVWYQTLDEDATPVPWDDHKRVYGNGTLKCDGTAAEGVLTYSNTQGADNTIPPHQYENGFCGVCGMFHAGYLTPVDGFYELQSAHDLHWFMTLVNMGEKNISAKLKADIDLTEMVDVIKPMEQFGGTFDGQGHIVDGYQHISPVRDAGFIRFGLDGLHLKNVIFKNAKIHTDDYAAGLIGGNVSGETSTFRLTNVGFEGEVTAGNVNAAGLIGSNHGTSSTYIIENCYVRGSMTGLGGGESAAFSGWAGKNAQLNNCWTDATITGYQEGRDAIRYNTVSIKNSYCVSALESPQLPTISEDDIASGALTWKLNGESFLNVSWYQTVNQDEMPVWDSSHGLVYKNGEDSYASVYDESTYVDFREYIVDSELEKASEIVADEALLDAYRTSLEAMRDIETLDEFLSAYAALDAQQKAIAASVALYAEYQKVCENAIVYLTENNLVCELAVQLDAYLNGEAAEPSETYNKNGNYQYIVENHLLTDEQIVAETAYVAQLLNDAIAADYKAGTEITALLTNANLAEGFEGWTVTGTPTAGGVKEIMPAAEGYNTVFSVTQTIEGMKDGIYKLAVNASFRPYGDDLSTLYAGTVSLNNNVNFVMVQGEDIVLKGNAEDGVNCHLTGDAIDRTYVYDEIEGYVPTGPIGCSYAFNAGRYINYTAVEVKDGKLTVGIQNPGTGMDRDWLGFGNFRLTYLGTAEEANDGLTEVLDGYVARAKVIRDFVASEGFDYAQFPNYSTELKGKLNKAIEAASTVADGAAKMALINEFSELFQQIYACRLAYTQLLKTSDAISMSLGTLLENGLIDQAMYDEVFVIIDKIGIAYTTGSVSIEESKELIEELNNCGLFPPVVDGVYQISNAKELGIFALMVNSGQKEIDGALIADIDLAGVVNWTPIGFNTADNNASDGSANVVTYAGKFDGQGHRIFNLTVNFPEGHGIGLFGTLDVGAEIKNLILDKTCTIIGYDKVGMIGRSTNGGHIYLDCLGNEGVVTANQIAAAGILGNANNGSIAHISNCYSTGVISAGSGKNAALICGWLGSTSPGGQVTNCWSIAEISGQDNNEKVFCRIGNATFTNNYSLIGTGNMSKVVTMDDFKSGKVTFDLNTGETPVWYQNLGTDEHPVLDNTHQIVYKREDGTYYNDGGNAIENVEGVLGETVNVYDVQGRQIRTAVSTSTGLKGLSQGMYILKGQSKSVKVLVK